MQSLRRKYHFQYSHLLYLLQPGTRVQQPQYDRRSFTKTAPKGGLLLVKQLRIGMCRWERHSFDCGHFGPGYLHYCSEDAEKGLRFCNPGTQIHVKVEEVCCSFQCCRRIKTKTLNDLIKAIYDKHHDVERYRGEHPSLKHEPCFGFLTDTENEHKINKWSSSSKESPTPDSRLGRLQDDLHKIGVLKNTDPPDAAQKPSPGKLTKQLKHSSVGSAKSQSGSQISHASGNSSGRTSRNTASRNASQLSLGALSRLAMSSLSLKNKKRSSDKSTSERQTSGPKNSATAESRPDQTAEPEKVLKKKKSIFGKFRQVVTSESSSGCVDAVPPSQTQQRKREL